MNEEERQEKIIDLKKRIRIKLDKQKIDQGLNREWYEANHIPPRYDEVFFKGTEWLNTL